MQRSLELLAPAGSLEKLKIALAYGADAVYLGGQEFSLRTRSQNFSMAEIREGIEYAHSLQRRVYFTLNIYAHNRDIESMPAYIEELAAMHVDAMIVSDPGVLRLVHRYAPKVAVHLSTQANTTNWESALFWQDLGVERLILARELTLSEIREIHQNASIDLEVFVHGAMCMAYSGRCLLSNFMTGRDANRGDCAQSCRWEYAVMEKLSRHNEYYPIEEDGRGTYVFNSKDLNLIRHLGALADSGVFSFKIEGRMKSIFYAATIARAYREALDAVAQGTWSDELALRLDEELGLVSHRRYTTGFLLDPSGQDAVYQESSSYIRKGQFLGRVIRQEGDQALVEVRGKFKRGQTIEIMGWRLADDQSLVVDSIEDEARLPIHFTKPNSLVWIPVTRPVQENFLVRSRI